MLISFTINLIGRMDSSDLKTANDSAVKWKSKNEATMYSYREGNFYLPPKQHTA